MRSEDYVKKIKAYDHTGHLCEVYYCGNLFHWFLNFKGDFPPCKFCGLFFLRGWGGKGEPAILSCDLKHQQRCRSEVA